MNKPLQKNSLQWKQYFAKNASTDNTTLWSLSDVLTADEKQRIQASLQDFQQGEYSEGKYLMRYAQDFAAAHQDPEYVESITYFIREEQHHAAVLARYMVRHDIPKKSQPFLDSVFRRLRRLAGLEFSIMVLQVAEIVSEAYYSALREATGSRLLKALCKRILQDEAAHLRFHAERLALLRRQRPAVFRSVGHLAQRALVYPSLLMVWWFHARCFKAGGYDFWRYMLQCHQVLNRAIEYTRQLEQSESLSNKVLKLYEDG